MRIALEISYSSLNDPTRKRNHDPNSIKTAFWVMNPTLKIGMKLKKYDPNGAKCFVWVIKSIKQLPVFSGKIQFVLWRNVHADHAIRKELVIDIQAVLRFKMYALVMLCHFNLVGIDPYHQ